MEIFYRMLGRIYWTFKLTFRKADPLFNTLFKMLNSNMPKVNNNLNVTLVSMLISEWYLCYEKGLFN